MYMQKSISLGAVAKIWLQSKILVFLCKPVITFWGLQGPMMIIVDKFTISM